jgi:hypothetical protein
MSDWPKPGRSGATMQKRDEIPEHVARAREAMKQEQHGCVGSPGLTVKDLQAVHIGGSVFDGGHWILLSSVTKSAGREGY